MESDTAGGFAGTPGYIAPELFQGSGVDPRADLFSLGCVLYRAATGVAAFEGENSTATFVHTITRTPTPAGKLNPKLDAEFAELIDRLLEKKAADRPESAAALLAELDAIAARRVARRKTITRRRWLAGLAGAGGIGGLAVWLTRTPGAPPVPPGKLKFEPREGIDKVAFSRDGAEEIFDLKSDTAVSLDPGEYSLRAVDAAAGLRLVPAAVIVESDAERTVKLDLVGEIDRLTPHGSVISGVAAIPSGERFDVLSAGQDRRLTLSRPATQSPAKFEKLESPARAFAATPDGRLAVTAGGNTQAPFDLGAVVWQAGGLKRLMTLDGHKRQIFAVAISPDGKHVITAARDGVKLWDIGAAEPKSRSLAGHTPNATILAAAFDAEGKYAVTAGERGQTILWDVAKAAFVAEVTAVAAGDASNAVRAVAFIGNTFCTAGDDGVIREWSGPPFKAREFPAEPKPILALAASADGRRLLSGGADGTIKLWRVEKAAAIETFTGHSGEVKGVAFSPGGREAISCGADRTIRIWRLPFD
jgi:WD40 repeat protein